MFSIHTPSILHVVLVSACSHLGNITFYTLMLNYHIYFSLQWMKPHSLHHTCLNGEIAYHGTLGETISYCYIEIMVIYARLSSQVWATILVKLHLLAFYEFLFYSGGDLRCCTFCPKGGTLCIKVSSSLPPFECEV